MAALLSTSLSVNRGGISVQPSYFTSSLFVNALRVDVEKLSKCYKEECSLNLEKSPFSLFKRFWVSQGWSSLHLMALDARGRLAFLNTVCRVFLEYALSSVDLVDKIVALFALFIFCSTSPSTPLFVIQHIGNIAVAKDTFTELIQLPSYTECPSISTNFRPYIIYILRLFVSHSSLFLLPSTAFNPHNPRVLPREVFQSSLSVPTNDAVGANPPKKPGRVSKKEKALKARATAEALSKWLERRSHAGDDSAADSGQSGLAGLRAQDHITPAILSQKPVSSLKNYQSIKADLLTSLQSQSYSSVLEGANSQVLKRLRRVDARAAERGLEVGGEGGEITGLSRIENAVLEDAKGGILGLLEGAGWFASLPVSEAA